MSKEGATENKIAVRQKVVHSMQRRVENISYPTQMCFNITPIPHSSRCHHILILFKRHFVSTSVHRSEHSHSGGETKK